MTKNKCHKSKIFQRSGAKFTLLSIKVCIFQLLSYFGLTLFEVRLVQGSVFFLSVLQFCCSSRWMERGRLRITKKQKQQSKGFAFKGFQTFLNLKKCMKNSVTFSRLKIGTQFQSLNRGMLVWSSNISIIFIVNSKIALVFETEMLNWTANEESLRRVSRFSI